MDKFLSDSYNNGTPFDITATLEKQGKIVTTERRRQLPRTQSLLNTIPLCEQAKFIYAQTSDSLYFIINGELSDL